MTKANRLLCVQCAAFLVVDFAAWWLSFSKLNAIHDGRDPGIYASAEGFLAAAGLFFGFDLAANLVGWRRWLFVAACGVVPRIAGRLT